MSPAPDTAAGERIEALFRTELIGEADRWESERRLPPKVFERLGQIGAFRARWPAPSTLGDIEVAIGLARECALVSPGGAVALGPHTDGFLPALAHSEWGRAVEEAAFEGSVIGAVAISESTSGSDVTTCETLAERDGDGWRITGHKQYVSNFPSATDCLVFARTDRRTPLRDFSLFLVPTDHVGVKSEQHRQIGANASGTCMVRLDGVQVGEERLVGKAGSGLTRILGFLRLERVWASAGSAAIAELCLEMALGYAGARRIQGKALRDHQVIAHRLADMDTAVKAARLMVADLLECARTGRLSALQSARAKLFTGQVAWQVADQTMQILGGRGYTAATPFERIWRDLRVIRIAGGSEEVLRELIARGLSTGKLGEHPDVVAVRESATTPEYYVRGPGEGTLATDDP